MKTIKKIIFSPVTLALAVVAVIAFVADPHTILAASSNLLDQNDRPDAAIDDEFRSAVTRMINYFLLFLGLIAVAFIIYAGVLMVTAQGEADGVDKGKKIILWAGAGIVIILLSYSIVRLFVKAGDAT